MAAATRKTLTVTVVPVVRDNPASLVGKVDDPLHFDSVSLITYEDPAPAPG